MFSIIPKEMVFFDLFEEAAKNAHQGALALQDLVARGGSLVLSGLMAVEETDVIAAFPAWSVDYRSEEDEWLCVVISPPQLPISPTAS